MSVKIPLKCELYVKDFPGSEPGTHRREITAQFWIEGRDNTKSYLSGVLIARPGEAMKVEWIDRNEVIGNEAVASAALLDLHDSVCADDLNRIIFRTIDLEPDINESSALLKIAMSLDNDN